MQRKERAAAGLPPLAPTEAAAGWREGAAKIAGLQEGRLHRKGAAPGGWSDGRRCRWDGITSGSPAAREPRRRDVTPFSAGSASPAAMPG